MIGYKYQRKILHVIKIVHDSQTVSSINKTKSETFRDAVFALTGGCEIPSLLLPLIDGSSELNHGGVSSGELN
jgi:hypothetical protein